MKGPQPPETRSKVGDDSTSAKVKKTDNKERSHMPTKLSSRKPTTGTTNLMEKLKISSHVWPGQ